VTTDLVDETAFALDLLANHIPLTLLLDLAQLRLTLSEEIARVERADSAWVHQSRACA
jgi:hypothetical protein